MTNTFQRVTSWVARACCKTPRANINWLAVRNFADITKKDSPSHIEVRHTKSDEIYRVRRVRPADVPGVLQFIRQHTRELWPSLSEPSNASQIVLSDYVSRALAQGHSMIAEHQDLKNNFSRIRALALGTTMCKWDAVALEKWARCVQCSRSRQLLMFTAHCLRAPALHDKYQVNNILQVILFVPADVSQRKEVIQMLAKSSIQRGRDVGFTVLRFDAASDAVIRVLEEMHLNKEWQIVYDVFGDNIKAREDRDLSVMSKTQAKSTHLDKFNNNYPRVGQVHSLTVYSAFTDTPQ